MWGETLRASIGYQRRRTNGLSWCPAARVRTAAPPSGCAQAASSRRSGVSARQRFVARHGTTSGASVKGRGCGCGRGHGRGSGRQSRARAARTEWATRKSAWRGAAADCPAYGGCVTRCYAIQLAQLRYFLRVLMMRPQQLPIPSYPV